MNLNPDEQQLKSFDNLCFTIAKYIIITYACVKVINVLVNFVVYAFGQLA